MKKFILLSIRIIATLATLMNTVFLTVGAIVVRSRFYFILIPTLVLLGMQIAFIFFVQKKNKKFNILSCLDFLVFIVSIGIFYVIQIFRLLEFQRLNGMEVGVWFPSIDAFLVLGTIISFVFVLLDLLIKMCER